MVLKWAIGKYITSTSKENTSLTLLACFNSTVTLPLEGFDGGAVTAEVLQFRILKGRQQKFHLTWKHNDRE